MPDFRVAETAAFDDKMIQAGNAAVGLWARAGAWCMQQLTDGFVPTRISRQMGTKAQADRLTDCGLWESVDGGYQFVKFLNHQRSKEQVESEKAAARERMKRVRSGERSTERKTNVQANSSAERSPHVHDSHPFPSLPFSGHLGGDSHLGERARNDNPPSPNQPTETDSEPPTRCVRHRDIDGDPGPCGQCASARKAHERWEVRDRNRRAEAQSAAALQAAELRATHIAACPLCDERGYRAGRVCDHDPDSDQRNARGMQQVREALAASKGASS